MTGRMLRWFFLSLVFALVPLAVILVVQWLTGNLTSSSLEDSSSEILFFSLMVSVTVMGDILEVNKRLGRTEIIYSLMMFFLLGVVITAVLYGIFQFGFFAGINVPGFRTKIMWLSLIMAIILFLVGTSTQVFVGRIADVEETGK